MAFNSHKKDEYSGSGVLASSRPSISYLGKSMKIKGKISRDEYLTVEGAIFKGKVNVVDDE